MKHMMIVAAAVIGAAGCATVESDAEASSKAEERLAAFDRTGEERTCLSLRAVNRITPLDERNFLVRVGVSDYYLNETNGRCGGADSTFNRLQYTTSLSQLCRNEIIRVVDNSTGFTVGSCSLGSFERLEEKPKDDEETS